MITPSANTIPASVQAQPTPGVERNNSSRSSLASDFETFLKMLTAQAKNQDPSEPINSTEYASQLAQFSMVEQQVLSNDLLKALTAKLSSGDIAQVSGWIGKEALTSAPIRFSGTPLELDVLTKPQADKAFLIVKNGAGKEVQRLPIEPENRKVTWAGVQESGTPLPNGAYNFEVESFVKGKSLGLDDVLAYQRVTEVRIDSGKPQLVLGGKTSVFAEKVTGLREVSAN